jgi:hypothetical protein
MGADFVASGSFIFYCVFIVSVPDLAENVTKM